MPRRLHPYIREHSKFIRCLTPNSHLTMAEDPIVCSLTGIARAVLVITCRNKQRLLTQAWEKWIHATGVEHDYERDVRLILSRHIPDFEYRTELEIEVFFKWIKKHHLSDPTGLAHLLWLCKSKTAVINAIQHCRLERYDPEHAIIIQNEFPNPIDGHFTILSGACDIIVFPPESLHLLRIHALVKIHNMDEVKNILNEGTVINTLHTPSGFGELSSLTNVKRAASVRASKSGPAELMVIPQKCLIECLNHRRVTASEKARNPMVAEAIDYLRQSGLAFKISPVDLFEAANSMEKKTFKRGTVLYNKGDNVNFVYLLITGDVFLDTADIGDATPFQNCDPEKCYILSSGSILGDEGMIGEERVYEASCVTISEVCICFRVRGFGIKFLSSTLGIEKFSALAYRDRTRSYGPMKALQDTVSLHTTFNTLRGMISAFNPNRGIATHKPDHSKRASSPTNSRPISPARHVKNKVPGGGSRPSSPSKAEMLHSSRLDTFSSGDDGLRVLSLAALHRLDVIQKAIKRRILQNMREVAQESILSIESTRFRRPETADRPPTPEKDKAMRRASIVKSEEKLERAIDMYHRRRKIERDEEEESSGPHVAVSSPALRILSMAADNAMNDFEEFSVSNTAGSAPIIETQPTADVIVMNDSQPKLEQYFAILKKKEVMPQANLNAIEGEDDHDNTSVGSAKNRPPQIVMRMTSMGQSGNRNKIEPFLRPTSVNTVNAEVVTIERDGYTQKRLLHRMKSSMNEKDNKKFLYRKRTMSGGAGASHSDKRKFKSQYTFSFGADSAPNTARSGSRDRQDSRLYFKQDSKHVTFTDQDILHSQTHSSKATTLLIDTIVEEGSDGLASPASMMSATPLKYRRGTRLPPSPASPPDICSTLGITTSEGIKALPAYEWNTRFMRITSAPAKPTVDETKLGDVAEPPQRRKSYSRTVAEKILKSGPLHLTLSKPATAPSAATITDTNTSESKSYSRSTSMGPVKTPRAVAKLQDTKWRSVGDNRWAQLTPKDSRPNTGTRPPLVSPKENNEPKNVLTKFYDIIEAEPGSCKYVDGRKNHASKSRFALKKQCTDEEQLFHTPPKTQIVTFDRSKSPAELDDEAELEEWKAYSLERAVETKFGEMKSLPVLASTGTHSMNWGKKVIKNCIG